MERNPDSRREANGWQRIQRTARLMLTWTSSIKNSWCCDFQTRVSVYLVAALKTRRFISVAGIGCFLNHILHSISYNIILVRPKNHWDYHSLSIPPVCPEISGLHLHSYSFRIGLEASFPGMWILRDLTLPAWDYLPSPRLMAPPGATGSSGGFKVGFWDVFFWIFGWMCRGWTKWEIQVLAKNNPKKKGGFIHDSHMRIQVMLGDARICVEKHAMQIHVEVFWSTSMWVTWSVRKR